MVVTIKKIAPEYENPDWVYSKQPLATAQAAIYKTDESLKNLFTGVSRYGDPIVLWRKMGAGMNSRIMVPREACPIGAVDKRVVGKDINFECHFKARNDEQERVVNELVVMLRSGKSGLFRAGTGFGKTVCTCAAVARIRKKTAVVVTKSDVRDQWVVAAKMVLKLKDSEIGFVQGDQCNTEGKKLVICMIQSLSKKGRYPEELFRDFGLVIWDEVHRVGATEFANTTWLFPALLRLGLSATPTRKDGKEIVFKLHIGPVRVSTDMMALIPKIYVLNSKWTVPMTNVRTKKGWELKPIPHKPGRIIHIMRIAAKNKARNLKIANFVKRAFDKGRRIIIFADTKKHLDQMQEVFIDEGLPPNHMGFYVGGLTKAKREAAKLKRIIFATYSFCSEATDIPWLDTMVMATPKSDVEQIVGRILREYDDKHPPVVLDVLDGNSNVLRGYYRSRLRWYKKIEATVIMVGFKI